MGDNYKFGFTGWFGGPPQEQGDEQPAPCTGTSDGYHCWEPTGVKLLVCPPSSVERCKHCPLTRHLVNVKKTYSYSGGG